MIPYVSLDKRSVGRNIFQNSILELLNWISQTKGIDFRCFIEAEIIEDFEFGQFGGTLYILYTLLKTLLCIVLIFT